MVEKVKENLAKYMREGSGWTFGKIGELEIHINQFKSLTSSLLKLTPIVLAKNKAIVNVSNEDKYCFQLGLLSVG